MKKTLLVIALVCAALGAVLGQEGAGGAAQAGEVMLNVVNYSNLFLNGNGLISPKYTRVASSEDKGKLRNLGGDPEVIDTPLEIALLSTCAGVVDVRPVEASNMLGTAKQADLKLGSAVLKELTELKFLDPNNRDAVGRYEGIIKFITDRGNVSRAEIESYYRQGIGSLIAEAVNAEFNKVRFGLGDPYTTTGKYYNATLTRDTQNKYVLSYEGYFAGIKQTKQITAPSLRALLTEMQSGANRADFDQNCINQVNAQNANIPAIFLERTGKDPRADLAAILTAFYLNPANQTVYGTMRDVNVYYTVARNISRDATEATLCRITQNAYLNAIAVLNLDLCKRVEADSQGRTSVTLSSEVRNRLQLVR
jgi:hypothetical protein